MKLKDLKKKYSTKEIAEAAGVSQAQVRNWLSQDRGVLKLESGNYVIENNHTTVIKIKRDN